MILQQSCEFTMMMIMQRETLFQILCIPFQFWKEVSKFCSTLQRCKHDSPWPCEWSANAKMQNSQAQSRGKALLVFSLRWCWLCNLSLVKAKDDVRWGLSSHCYRFKTSWKDKEEKLHNITRILIACGRIFSSFKENLSLLLDSIKSYIRVTVKNLIGGKQEIVQFKNRLLWAWSFEMLAFLAGKFKLNSVWIYGLTNHKEDFQQLVNHLTISHSRFNVALGLKKTLEMC